MAGIYIQGPGSDSLGELDTCRAVLTTKWIKWTWRVIYFFVIENCKTIKAVCFLFYFVKLWYNRIGQIVNRASHAYYQANGLVYYGELMISV